MQDPREAPIVAIEDALGVIFRLGRQAKVQERLASRAGITIERAAYPVLGRIAQGSPVRISAVASSVGLDLSTVSRHVQHLQDAGLVGRSADDADRRACALSVTRDGRKTLERLHRAHRASLDAALEDWSAKDLQTMSELVSRLANDLDRYWADRA